MRSRSWFGVAPDPARVACRSPAQGRRPTPVIQGSAARANPARGQNVSCRLRNGNEAERPARSMGDRTRQSLVEILIEFLVHLGRRLALQRDAEYLVHGVHQAELQRLLDVLRNVRE